MAYDQAEHAISELDYFISRVRSSILPVLWCEPVAKAWHWLRGESRAMADVRTLDDWADAVDDRSVDLSCGWLVAFKDKPHLQPPGQIRVRLLVGGDPVHIEYGATPDEARAKAAAWVRSEQARKVLGEPEQVMKPCEVTMVGGGAGYEHEDWDCGQPARIEVNGFPMCAHHFEEYERDGLIESVAVIADQPAAPAPKCDYWPNGPTPCGKPATHHSRSGTRLFCSYHAVEGDVPLAETAARGAPRPACTCGAYNEPDYSDGDHIAPCPRAQDAPRECNCGCREAHDYHLPTCPASEHYRAR